jgi:hypothetical protein
MDAEKAAEQKRQVKSAAQSLLGCAGLIAVVGGVYWLLGWLPRSVAEGPNVIAMIDRSGTNNWLFWGAVVGTFLFFILLGLVKSTLGAVVVCLAYAGVIAATLLSLYGPFAAVAFEPNAVELRYVWPRPAQRLAAAQIVSVKVEETAHTADSLHVLDYILHVQTASGDYASFSTPNMNPQLAARRIEQMRKR